MWETSLILSSWETERVSLTRSRPISMQMEKAIENREWTSGLTLLQIITFTLFSGTITILCKLLSLNSLSLSLSIHMLLMHKNVFVIIIVIILNWIISLYCSFYVDDVPIRVYKNSGRAPFPMNQPMGVYSTLWEADDWATRGGLEKIDWSKAPFYAYYRDFDIEGCPVPGPANCASNPGNWWEANNYQALTAMEARRYRWVRLNHMIYDYCTDKSRYPVPPPECLAGI